MKGCFSDLKRLMQGFLIGLEWLTLTCLHLKMLNGYSEGIFHYQVCSSPLFGIWLRRHDPLFRMNWRRWTGSLRTLRRRSGTFTTGSVFTFISHQSLVGRFQIFLSLFNISQNASFIFFFRVLKGHLHWKMALPFHARSDPTFLTAVPQFLRTGYFRLK